MRTARSMWGSAVLKANICSSVISSFPGALATEIFDEISFPTSKLAPIDAIENSAGRIHSLKKGVATKSFRGIRFSSRNTSRGGHPIVRGQSGLWKAQYFLK